MGFLHTQSHSPCVLQVSTTEVTAPPSPTPSSSTPPSSAAPLSSPPSSPSTPAADETTATEAAVSTTHRTSLLGRPRPAYVPLRRPSTKAPLDPSATASPIPRATPTTASRFSARFTASRGNRRGLSTAASQKTETVVTGPDAAFPTSPTKLFPATAVPRHRFSSRIKSTDYILAAVALPPAPLGRQFDDDDDEEESTEETTATTVRAAEPLVFILRENIYIY
ncbi:hypothetical protein ONE63_005786 [Megalurothrips usitatus]|uniref:Uncharacterized protein n=1 Tax=Megalurothrips usitatus TaxID=439358 RepID=A0AAV7XXP0_9NEOP|nr:hypothetical protein ONE63_005786 [Megalurothrips usitatus]